MKDWVKLNSFDRLHPAELRKDILKQNDINAIVVQNKDSAFLWGEIDLIVEKENLDKARALIDEFIGAFKVNSSSRSAQVESMQKILINNGIDSTIKKKSEFSYLIDNYELYVDNEDLEKTLQVIEELTGWTKILSTDRLSQAELRIAILKTNKINALLVKKRDSDKHVEEIKIYVEDENLELANTALKELKGWSSLIAFDKGYRAVLRENMLLSFKVPVITVEQKKETETEPGVYLIFIEDDKIQTAKDLLLQHRDWSRVRSFAQAYRAEMLKEYIEAGGVETMMIIHKGTAFLWGEVELFVETDLLNEALKLAEDFENSKFTN